jgi:hypothetical protein
VKSTELISHRNDPARRRALDQELLRDVFCSSSFRGIAFVSETVVIGSIDNALLLIHQNFCPGAFVVELGVTAYEGEQGRTIIYESYQRKFKQPNPRIACVALYGETVDKWRCLEVSLA